MGAGAYHRPVHVQCTIVSGIGACYFLLDNSYFVFCMALPNLPETLIVQHRRWVCKSFLLKAFLDKHIVYSSSGIKVLASDGFIGMYIGTI